MYDNTKKMNMKLRSVAHVINHIIFLSVFHILLETSFATSVNHDEKSILPPGFVVLDPNDYADLLFIDNASQLQWAIDTVPFFDIDNVNLRDVYFFRWMSFHAHIFNYPDVGYVITEFLPNVPWAGKYDTIPCAAGHHIAEGRWLRNRRIVADYLRFWFRGGGDPRRYNFWAATAAWDKYSIDGNKSFIVDLLPDLVNNLYAWRDSNAVPFGTGHCFFSTDGADGGELSISGSGCRPTINSIMVSEARAIVDIASLLPSSTVIPGVKPPAPTPGGKVISNNTFCCNTPCIDNHSHFVFEGKTGNSEEACASKCLSYDASVCRYYTYYTGGSWCQISTFCNQTWPVHNPPAATFERPSGPIPPATVTAGELIDEFKKWDSQLSNFIKKNLWNNITSSFATLSSPQGAPMLSASRETRETTNQITSSDSSTVSQCPPSWPKNQTVTVRELLGYTPWFFGVINGSETDTAAFDLFWQQLTDKEGFAGAWGLRTAERRSPCYNFSGAIGDHECSWNGPSWPYETSRVISAVANVLRNYPQHRLQALESYLNRSTLYGLLDQFAKQHTTSTVINGSDPWIGEDIHPDDGYWIARFMMYMIHSSLRNRGKFYNHSTFIDLILSRLLGIKFLPTTSTLVVDPILPVGSSDWFAVDHLAIGKNHNVSIVWDATGKHWPDLRPSGGFSVYVDGKIMHNSPQLERVKISLD